MKTALLLGASGMTGNYLLHQLLEHPEYKTVKIFVRKSLSMNHPKLVEFVVDFNQPESWQKEVSGDIAYSAFGTTLSTAGSKEKQWKIDHTYQLQFAQACERNKVPVYVLISSMGANKNSRFFYMKMKGDLDEQILRLSIPSIHILRPGSLKGDRKEYRSKEKRSLAILRFFNRMGLFRKYRAIHGNDLAKKMIQFGINDQQKVIHEYPEILKSN
ncbi:MAG: NAD(P)H-binding protein [Flavobacteriales bacterium]|nr:NAD(P)H-binding protein [Flavobacteriales bacterium]